MHAGVADGAGNGQEAGQKPEKDLATVLSRNFGTGTVFRLLPFPESKGRHCASPAVFEPRSRRGGHPACARDSTAYSPATV